MSSNLTIPTTLAGSSIAGGSSSVEQDNKKSGPNTLAPPSPYLSPRKSTSTASTAPRNSIDDVMSNMAAASIDVDRSRTESINTSIEGFDLPKARADLLQAYRKAITRPVDPQAAVSALKLRVAAQVHFDKNDLNRFLPNSSRSANAQARLETLKGMSADEVIADLQANPDKYSRTLLNDLANHHFIQSLSINYDEFIDGVKSAAKLEHFHTTVARGITLAASMATTGATVAIPGADTMVSEGARAAAKAGKKALKFIGRQLPTSVVNPFVSGKLRVDSSVKQLERLKGGTPSLAANFGKNASLKEVAESIKEKIPALVAANNEFRNAKWSGGDQKAAMRAMVDAYLELHGAANDEYKARIGVNRTQTYGKAYGAGLNGIAAVGSLVAVAAPGPGTAVGIGIQAASLLLQSRAGYLDKQTEQTYSIRANLKWGDFLTEEAKHLPYTELQPHHIDQNALRRAHITQPELHLAAIREAYPDELGKLMAEQDKLADKVNKASAAGRKGPEVDKMRADLDELSVVIDQKKTQAWQFESLDPKAWKDIPAGSTIGKCLDDASAAYKAQRKARHRLVGEVGKQVLQRYAQAAHMGVSSGITVPISDALTAVDGLHVDGDPDRALMPQSNAAVIGVGAVGGTAFTATTTVVRTAKADSGRTLRDKVAAKDSRRAAKLEKDEKEWKFEAGGKLVDLTRTMSYDELYHTPGQRAKRLVKAVGPALMSGAKAASGLTKAKLARREARQAMEMTIALLHFDAGRDKEWPARASNFTAMRHALYDHPDVAEYLKGPGGLPVPQVAIEDTSTVASSQAKTIDLDLELEKMDEAKAAKAAASTTASTSKSAASTTAKVGHYSTDMTDTELARILLWLDEKS